MNQNKYGWANIVRLINANSDQISREYIDKDKLLAESKMLTVRPPKGTRKNKRYDR